MKSVFISHPPAARALYFGDKALQALREFADVRCNPAQRCDTEAILALAADCDVLIADRQTEGSAALLAGLPKLLAFCRVAVDIRNIDVEAASRHGILVTQASAGFMASVSEWIVGSMIDLSRGITEAAAAYRRGEVPAMRMGRELRGATLGVIGYGQIARHLVELARAFGMRVCVADPYAPPRPGQPPRLALPELLADADYVVCLANAHAGSENLMDDAAFAAMKPGAFFINASRGNLVDEAALLRALDSGRLGGCALDVGRAPDQMPSPTLARHPKVIATPHIGGLTPPAIEHQALETVGQVREILGGAVPRQGAVNAAHARRLAAATGARP